MHCGLSSVAFLVQRYQFTCMYKYLAYLAITDSHKMLPIRPDVSTLFYDFKMSFLPLPTTCTYVCTVHMCYAHVVFLSQTTVMKQLVAILCGNQRTMAPITFLWILQILQLANQCLGPVHMCSQMKHCKQLTLSIWYVMHTLRTVWSSYTIAVGLIDLWVIYALVCTYIPMRTFGIACTSP